MKNNTKVVGAEIIVDGRSIVSDSNGTAYHDNSGSKFRIGQSVKIKVKATGCFAQEKSVTFVIGDGSVKQETFELNAESMIISIKKHISTI